jgi:hypothetical protein
MPWTSQRAFARIALVAVVAIAAAAPMTLVSAGVRGAVAIAAVRDPGTDDPGTPPPRGANALQDAAERAGQIGRVVALSLIG